jgi:hypothetical protein
MLGKYMINHIYQYNNGWGEGGIKLGQRQIDNFIY